MLTPDTLSQWLNHTVTDIRIHLAFETPISKLLFINATYSTEATDLPRQLVVKSPLKPPISADLSELQFYRQLSSIGTPPLVPCLATIEDTCTIVLEDIRATHDHPPWPLPPSPIQCELAIDALAHVHAQCWESPALGDTLANFPTSESLTEMVQGIAAYLPAFIDVYGDALTIEARKILERVFSSSLKPWLRLTDRHALTIAHGDAHTLNFLFPRSGDGLAFLIDWQLWHIDVGARDLAYLMALHWYPGKRRELERPLLRRYHERLIERGIGEYSFDELWLDYRRCAVRNLTIPLLFWSRGMKPEGWWHRLECALASYRELECEELL